MAQAFADTSVVAAPAKPIPKDEAVSAQMRRMPRSSTTPELRLRTALHAAGLRFRVNYRALPGSPDLAFTRAKLAVFVDGCFWHSCPDHSVLPKNNREWWRSKLAGNVERDRRKDNELAALGWEVIHVWEHQDPESAAARVTTCWRERTGRVEVPDH